MMTSARSLLIVGGLVAAIWGMGYGIWYALFDEHQTLTAMGSNLAGGFIHAAAGDLDKARQSLEQFSRWSGEYTLEVHAHGHWIALGMLLMVLGLAIDALRYGQKTRYLLALMLLVGTFVFPTGILLQTTGLAIVGKVLSVLGSGLLLVSMFLVAIGITARGSCRGYAWDRR